MFEYDFFSGAVTKKLLFLFTFLFFVLSIELNMAAEAPKVDIYIHSMVLA